MSGRGKGAKGFGKRDGAKRPRKIIHDSIKGITKTTTRRLAQRGGVKRPRKIIHEELSSTFVPSGSYLLGELDTEGEGVFRVSLFTPLNMKGEKMVKLMLNTTTDLVPYFRAVGKYGEAQINNEKILKKIQRMETGIHKKTDLLKERAELLQGRGELLMIECDIMGLFPFLCGGDLAKAANIERWNQAGVRPVIPIFNFVFS